MEKIRFRQLTFFDQKTIKGNYFPHDETSFEKPGWILDDGSYQYDRIIKGIKFDKSSKEVAIDIGANVGIITRLLCNYYKLVLSFEPSSNNRACIYRNQEESNNNLIIYPYALGNKNENNEIRIAPANSGGCSLKEEFLPDIYENIRKEKILVRRLDDVIPLDIMNKSAKVSLIKLDIQGYELEALQGAENLLATHKPIIICEVLSMFGSIEEEINKYLFSINYEKIAALGKERYYKHIYN